MAVKMFHYTVEYLSVLDSGPLVNPFSPDISRPSGSLDKKGDPLLFKAEYTGLR